jgi:hypothetical protein
MTYAIQDDLAVGNSLTPYFSLVVYPSDLKMLVSARIKWLSDKAPI